MPELPDLEVLKEVLASRILGRKIDSARALRPGIVKTASPMINSLSGRAFSSVSRRGKYLILTVEPRFHLVVHLMVAGRFVLCRGGTKITKATGLQIAFADGEDLRLIENGPIKLAKVHAVEDPLDVEGVASAGVEPLSPERELIIGEAVFTIPGRSARALSISRPKMRDASTSFSTSRSGNSGMRSSPLRTPSTSPLCRQYQRSATCRLDLSGVKVSGILVNEPPRRERTVYREAS